MKENTKHLRQFITCDYVRWLTITKYFSTPMPMNILAMLQGSYKTPDPNKDWKLDPLACTFNSALNLKAEDKVKFTAFLLVYFKRDANEYLRSVNNPDYTIKAMAENHGVHPSTISKWGHDLAEEAYILAKRMMNSHKATG